MTVPCTIYVYADWVGLNGPLPVGELRVQMLRGKEHFDFTYNSEWLRSGNAVSIDPELRLFEGPHFVSSGRRNFGVFLDSSPDRWGRTIMQRRHAERTRTSGETPGSLQDADYLLGVYDTSRIGGLRFKLAPQSPFLNDDEENAVPPWLALRQLENASLRYEQTDLDTAEWRKLLQLLAPGSSLGGARPKASVLDEKGQMWIAKFPSTADDHNVSAWEYLAYQLAYRCGIQIPEVRLEKFGSKHHTLLSRRFDRTKNGERIHMASAMTMLSRNDGDSHATPVSYLDIAAEILQRSQNTSEQLEELWRRIMFNVLVSNTDDHLRNHSFLFVNNAWELSPVYDVNPVAAGNGLHLNISESDNALDPNLVLSVAGNFRIGPERASEILAQMQQVISSWEHEAKRVGITKTECKTMARAFRWAVVCTESGKDCR